MIKSPCLNCGDRKEKCHSDCEKYKSFKIDVAIMNREKEKVRQSESLKFMPKKY